MGVLIGFAFLAGIVTILSPCILPVLPVVLGSSAGGGKARPWGVVTGFIASFTVFTLTLSALVQALHFDPDLLRWIAAGLITLFGLVLVIPFLKDGFMRAATAISGRFALQASPQFGKKTPSGFFSGLLLGASLGLVWTPCVGPIMASVVSLALSQTVDAGSIFITLAYSAGTAVPLFLILQGGRSLLNRFPFFTRHSGAIQRIFGVLMLVTGIAILAGWDRGVETWLLKTFPNYGAGLTAIENQKVVREQLERRMGLSTADTASSQVPVAPFSHASGVWINSPPLTMASLRGKVVLVDFWTYSCINCLRTLPYLKAWYQKYNDKGLVIVGVHSPEFAFEHKESNVRQAVKDLGVTWPVVQDNKFGIWNAFHNHYWPAEYLFDKEGNLVESHFGEGGYAATERNIQKLLGTHETLAATTIPSTLPQSDDRTPETYLGWARASGFVGTGPLAPDQFAHYAIPQGMTTSQWALSGEWRVGKQIVESRGPASLTLKFRAQKVYLVINPIKNAPKTAFVSVDGQAVTTADVHQGLLELDHDRLYELYAGSKEISGTLQVKFPGPVKIFSFTFG